MDFAEIALTTAVVATGWLVFDGMRARERATDLARKYCTRHGLQFLDGTASLTSIGVVRTEQGLRLRRRYQFDYTTVSTVRNRGLIVLLGREVEHFLLEPDMLES